MDDWTTSEHAVGIVGFLLDHATYLGIGGVFLITVLYAFKSWKHRTRD